MHTKTNYVSLQRLFVFNANKHMVSLTIMQKLKYTCENMAGFLRIFNEVFGKGLSPKSCNINFRTCLGKTSIKI